MTDADWHEGSQRLEPFLSDRGRAARMPIGIRVWAERAARAGALDATLGVITAPAELRGMPGDGHGIAFLPAVRSAFGAWSPEETFPYAPVAGVTAFRERWRRWIAHKAGVDAGANARLEAKLTMPVATSGISGALAVAGFLCLDPGDEIVVPETRWDGYDTTFGLVCGARLRSVRLLNDGAWDRAAWRAALEASAARQARVVCVANFPNNPTGYVTTAEEAEALVAEAAGVAERSGRPVVIVFDDAYEGFVYVDRPRASPFFRAIDHHPRVLPIKCDGITKELLFWGARLGAITTSFPDAWGEAGAAAAAVWENKVGAFVRGMISSASTPVQHLVARLLDRPEEIVAAREPLIASLSERRDLLAAALETGPAANAFLADPFHGGLFALLHLRTGNAVRAAERLLDEHAIGVVPFHDTGRGLEALRITYATLPPERVASVVEAATDVVTGGRKVDS